MKTSRFHRTAPHRRMTECQRRGPKQRRGDAIAPTPTTSQDPLTARYITAGGNDSGQSSSAADIITTATPRTVFQNLSRQFRRSKGQPRAKRPRCSSLAYGCVYLEVFYLREPLHLASLSHHRGRQRLHESSRGGFHDVVLQRTRARRRYTTPRERHAGRGPNTGHGARAGGGVADGC